MKCQMLSHWENKKKKKKKKKNVSKYGMIKLLHRALAHLFDVCEKFNTVALKGQGFSQTLQDVFSLLLICLTLNYFICGILIKKILRQR